jgi:hypothetical protein
MQRRLNIKAQFADRGVFSPVCYSCYTIDNGWFSDKDSAAYKEAAQGQTRDRMTDFLSERKLAVEDVKRALKTRREDPMSVAWKESMARQLAVSIAESRQLQPGSSASGIGRKLVLGNSESTIKLRHHWVNDRNIVACQNPSCRIPFTLNERKHHCRICGKVFCAACSPKQLDILQFLPEDVSTTFADDGGLWALQDDDEARGFERSCDICVRDLREHRIFKEMRSKLDGAGAHVLCNLYSPIPGYTKAVDAALDKLKRSNLYLDRITELATGPDAIELTEMAIADVQVIKVVR